MPPKLLASTSVLALMCSALLANDTTTVTFSDGPEGWSGPNGDDGFGGGTTIEPTGGNTGAYMRTVFNDFGISYINTTNDAFLGDYTASDTISIEVDLRVEHLGFFGGDVSRPWLVELRDFDTAQGSYPWTSVWFLFDNISQANNDQWTTYSTGSFDPNAIELPAGWGGTGAEDPKTFEPMLPQGVTFADVLSGVDVIVFTTLQPGFFFGFTDHTIGIDNITITRSTSACQADINNDGDLNFFDVSAFLAAFAAADPIADFTGDGTWNFFDVSAFLSALADGCP